MMIFRTGPNSRERPKPKRPVLPTMRRAFALLKPYRLLVGAYLATIALASLSGLGNPLILRELIDHAIPEGDRGQLNLLIGAMVGLVLLGALNSTLTTFLSTTVSSNVLFDLRSKIYRHLTGMSLRWFTSNRTGQALSRVTNDVSAVQGVLSDTIGGVLSNLITAGSTMVVMVALDWRLALFSLLSVPLFLVPSRIVGQKQRELAGEAQEQIAGMNSQMQETLSVSGALLVKTFGRQDHEIDVFQGSARSIRDIAVRRAMLMRWFGLSLGLFGSIAPAVVYWYGGHRVIGGEASLGTVVALAALLVRVFGPISSLLSLHVTVLASIAAFERIFDYLDLEHDIRDRPDAKVLTDVRGRITFDGVDFSYVEGHPTLRDVSFEVQPGQFAALVGPTGAGKTTIAYLVPRLYDVDGGRVLIDGHDVRDVTLASLGQHIGMVNQDPFLFHTSIMQNLRYAKPGATDAEVHAAAKAANIHDFIESLPWGYETIVGERGYRLSGGERQRVAIARALLKDPAILILDEATSSVDSETERAIQEALDRLTRGRTVLAIAHRLSTIQAADLILVVEQGRIVEQGRHDELLACGGLYARLHGEQFGQRERIRPVGPTAETFPAPGTFQVRRIPNP